MKSRMWLFLLSATGASLLLGSFAFSRAVQSSSRVFQSRPEIVRYPFDVQVLMDGQPLEQYAANGRRYVQAFQGREYELRVRNPFPYRVAVALSVDGLNTIDARHSSAWEASKWVIEPYGMIDISGWQVSSSRARHFYFTTERDSYGARLGQTANLGVISAVFFRELQPVVTRTTPPRPWPEYEKDDASPNSSPKESARAEGANKAARSYPPPDDESAATGIGRSVGHDVRWVHMDLERHPASEVTIRYEFYQGLVRLGVFPRPYQRDVLRRREDARGFEDRRFSPEP